MIGTVQERFDAKYIPEPMSGCWLWTAANTGEKQAYGTIRMGKKNQLAHRLSYELHCGEIPDGMQVLHRCDNSFCVNPEHLFLGTTTDNMRDMQEKGRKVVLSGLDHGMTKLNPVKAFEIRWYAAIGTKHKTIAEMYDVSRPLVSMVVRNECWQQECHD